MGQTSAGGGRYQGRGAWEVRHFEKLGIGPYTFAGR